VAAPPAPPLDGRSVPVWLVSHGWHVGLAVRRADVPREAWPESGGLGTYRHLEVGWGDAEYFPARRGTTGMALRAAFASTSSALHVVGFDEPVPEFFPDSTIVELALGPAAFEALCRFVHDAYWRDAGGRLVLLAPGAYGHGHFYRARGRYHLFSNSNHWTARALEVAGLDLDARWAFTAGSVLSRASRYGRAIRDATSYGLPSTSGAPRPESRRSVTSLSRMASSRVEGADF
jgi:uncharacterized protein (TIGR02117 family)